MTVNFFCVFSRTSFYFILLNFSCFAESPFLENQPNAVLQIQCYHECLDSRRPWISVPISESVGSGFVIEGNQILTNAHVVQNAKFIEIKKPLSAKHYIAQLKYISTVCDLAMLQVEDPTFFEDIHPYKMGPLPKQNSSVTTLGYPIGGNHLSFTNGVVSRIDKIIYSHSEVDEHLAVQTDAAINPGNSGGPVIQDGLVVGIAFQGIEQGDNIGYFIPTTVINHFLKDASDGSIDEVPELGVYYIPLPPPARPFLKLSDKETGVVIYEVTPGSPADGILQKNDLLTNISGHKIDDDGTFWLDGLQVSFYEIMERSQWGDTVTLTWVRNGEKQSKEIVLKKYKLPIEPGRQFETNPEYAILGGLVFVKLSGDLFHTFGKDWWGALPPEYRYLYYFQAFQSEFPPKNAYLVLSEILLDPSNANAVSYQNQILESVNGVKITDFESLERAFKVPLNEFHTFQFYDNPLPLVLLVDQVKKNEELLLKKYDIALKSHIKQAQETR